MTRFFFQIILILSTFNECFSTSIFTQPLGTSGRFLTTSIGLGSPPQYYDLALTTHNDEFFLLDYNTANPKLDYHYSYIKAMHVPESSDTSELNTEICRARLLVDQGEKSAFGNYLTDYITLGLTMYGTPMRFCKLYQDRTGITQTSNDPLKWLFELPVDGFLGLVPGRENPIRKMREGTGDNLLTLWLDKQSTEPDNAGLITFGAHNIHNCVSEVKTVSVEDNDRWNFFVTKVTYGNVEDKLNNGLALFDFNSDSLTVPQKTFVALESAYGGNIERFYCQYYKQPQNIVVNAYGINLTVDVSNFVSPLKSNEGYCELNIAQAAVAEEIQLVLGKQFLKQFCVTLDYDNFLIQFAETRTNA